MSYGRTMLHRFIRPQTDSVKRVIKIWLKRRGKKKEWDGGKGKKKEDRIKQGTIKIKIFKQGHFSETEANTGFPKRVDITSNWTFKETKKDSRFGDRVYSFQPGYDERYLFGWKRRGREWKREQEWQCNSTWPIICHNNFPLAQSKTSRQ